MNVDAMNNRRPLRDSGQHPDSKTDMHRSSQSPQSNGHNSFNSTQTLPSISALTSGLPPGGEQNALLARHSQVSNDTRDSGNWSISQSKHSSTVSSQAGGLHLHTILNNNDNSPTRTSIPTTPSSNRVNSFQHQTPQHQHQQSQQLPNINQGYDPTRASTDTGSFLESRRSSVDSRINSGFTHLNLSPASPYESTNNSRVSVGSHANQQRMSSGESRQMANTMSPLGPRAGLSPNMSRKTRVAPPIHPHPRGMSGAPDPMAAAPTKGYAWAFPGAEPENEHPSPGNLPTRPRTSSFTASVDSSVYEDRSLPPGQHRLSEEVPYTHHHSLQHRSVTSLQTEGSVAGGPGNYSRTPELRVSHKMAERKRRSEMKGLFDELNNILPNSPGSKSSKWEILTKSIEYIRSLRTAHDGLRQENARLENGRLQPGVEPSRRAQEDIESMRNEIVAMWQQLRRVDPNNPHIYGNLTHSLAQQHGGPAPATNGSVLPPISHSAPQPPAERPAPQQQWSSGPTSAPTAMQGVEFAGGRAFERR